MAKYNRSNYTLNKFSTGIVYVFDSEIIEATLEDASLTEIQKKCFIQYYFLNVSIRQIAKNEGRHMSSIQESLLAATKKLNMLFFKK
ncbi:MAG: hypothetical protein BEN19_00805 [Epulopiscium sp. Nuni2H_MBin003]|nr:MAG: hypothetical protein BEN19_00805 [Epulopiscium sp. Nuni2H_MBin003]